MNKYYNAAYLPELPVVEGFPVTFIRAANTTGKFQACYLPAGTKFFYTSTTTVTSDDTINTGIPDIAFRLYTLTIGDSEWTQPSEDTSSTGGFGTRGGIVWTNTDITVGSVDSETLFMGASEPSNARKYSCADDVFSYTSENLTIVRYLSKQDDGIESVTGTSWYNYNSRAVDTIYVCGNSWIGFGASTEHLRVNMRDGALYTVLRDEGNACGVNFVKIRWIGLTHFRYPNASYILDYSVVLWQDGDISLRFNKTPTEYFTGTFSLTAQGTDTFTKPATTAIMPYDVTFVSQDPGKNGNFVVSYGLKNLGQPPKYLVKSGNQLYNIVDGALNPIDELESLGDTFSQFGQDTVPDKILLASLVNPIIMRWCETSAAELPTLSATVIGVPQTQTLYSPTYRMDYETVHGIEKVIAVGSDNVLTAISFDSGQTWKMWTETGWGTLSDENSGMTLSVLNSITSPQWQQVATTTTFKFRVSLSSADDYITSLTVDFIN